jgi:hydrogenase maturation protein HypF
LVATSANREGEPLCIDETQARLTLGALAQGFLVNDRRIARRCDDSLVRVAAGRPLLLRRARGYVPDPIACEEAPVPTIGVGGHLKTTVARAVGRRIEVSTHLGDLDCEPTRSWHAATARAWAAPRSTIACDSHPDYPSTTIARQLSPSTVSVQHHLAHAAAVRAEHRIDAPVLAVIWDGSGYGTDGMMWGGEFLYIDGRRAHRIACFAPFSLLGGEQALREPRRIALALLSSLGDAAVLDDARIPTVACISPGERAVLGQMLRQGINAPQTTSVGRLFDGVASLLGLAQTTTYEAQAAIALEAAALDCPPAAPYPCELCKAATASTLQWIDWCPLIRAIVADVRAGVDAREIAARFHATLATALVRVLEYCGLRHVLLAGGCFQNARLLEACILAVEAGGASALWPRSLPPNDGALAVGQAYAAARGMVLEA